MSSFDDLVRNLRQVANMWFRKEDILKLEKLIDLARQAEFQRTEIIRYARAADAAREQDKHAAS